MSGRITSIAVGPGGSRIYAGAANGGVWYSSDSGANWSPLDDYIVSPTLTGGAAEADSLSIGALAVHFGASAISDVVFVGTGEPNGNYDAYLGIGIRRLAAGVWTLEATNLANYGIYAVVIDPNDTTPTNIYAATTRGLFKRPTAGSVATWTPVTSASFTNGTGMVCDFLAAGSGAGRTFYAAFYGDKVYSSPDGATWTALSGLTAGPGVRIALGASESSSGVVYAILSNGSLYRLSGTTFYPVTGLPPSVLFADPGGGQGWYDIGVAVSPADPNTIILGGDAYAVFKGAVSGSPGSFTFPFNAANTGAPWNDPTWVGQHVHSDVHAITFGLNAIGPNHDPNNVWVGSDGGLFQSTTGAAAGSFRAHNLGLAITEFAYLAQRADTDAVLFAGAQDNGTPRLLSEEAGEDMAGGDGGGTAVDPTNPYRIMRQYVRAYLSGSVDGGATWTGVNFPPSAASPATELNATGFVAPLRAFAAGATPLVAFGTNRLWLSADWGANWITLPSGTNPYSVAPPNLAQDVIDSNPVTAIAFASATRIFAATYTNIWRYDQAGVAWSRTALPTAGLPPYHYITALAPDLDPAAASGSLYATLGSGGVAHVYYYDGAAWHIAMPNTVVDVPTHAIVVDPVAPTTLYVGADVGCFKGVKTGPTTWTWSLFSQGLPEAAITDLTIFATGAPARLLRAATHGRSVWEIDLAATVGVDPDLYVRVNYADSGRLSATNSRFPWVEGALDPTHVGYPLYHYMCADIKVRRSSLVGLPPLSSPVTYLDFAANIGDYVDSTTHLETGDVSGVDQIFVELHNRSLNAVPAAQVRALLLWTDASAGLPALPVGWASHINTGDTSATWLGPNWHFVDTTTPYRTPPRDVDVRTPQVVQYQLDFGSLGLIAGHDHVCLAIFVTAPGDSITSTLTDLNQVTMTDKHVGHRNVHLVPLGARPIIVGGPMRIDPQTFVLDFHNPTDKPLAVDLVFDRAHFPGHLSLLLPKLKELAHPQHALSGFRMEKRDALEVMARDLVGEWLERTGEWLRDLGELLEEDEEESGDPVRELEKQRAKRVRSLDPTRSYVADAHAKRPAITGVTIPGHGRISTAVTIQAPEGAKIGDRYRLDVLQQREGKLIGGSSYIIAVFKERTHLPR